MGSGGRGGACPFWYPARTTTPRPAKAIPTAAAGFAAPTTHEILLRAFDVKRERLVTEAKEDVVKQDQVQRIEEIAEAEPVSASFTRTESAELD